MADERIVTLTLRAATERYGDIAGRWPSTIVITGSLEQCGHFLVQGIYEAGCDHLFVPPDEEDGLYDECTDAYFAKEEAKKKSQGRLAP